jgi:hypothetical protein
MNMQSLVNGSPSPKNSKRSRIHSESSDITNEHPAKRTSMPNILNDISSSVPPATSNLVLPPISSVLKEAAAAESRPNPPYLPSARTRMSIAFILNGPNLPPVSYTRTEAPTALLVLNDPYRPQPERDPRMTIDYILDAPDQSPPARDPRMTIDYILNAPDQPELDPRMTIDHILNAPHQSPPAPATRMPVDDIPNGPNPQPLQYEPLKLMVSLETFNDLMDMYPANLAEYGLIEVVAPVSLRSRVAFKNYFEYITFDLSRRRSL